jgi:hypothetical protein
MKKRYFLLVFSTYAILAIIILGACRRDKSVGTDEGKVTVREKSKKIELKGDKGTLTITRGDKEGHVNIKTEEGETIKVSYGEDKLPDNFPKDVPIYSPSKVMMSQTIDSKKRIMASLSTEDDPSEVAQFYKKVLPQKGWKIKGEMSMGNMFLIQGGKGEIALNVTINREDQKTIVSLVIGEE